MNPLLRKYRTARRFSPATLRTFRIALLWIPLAGGLIRITGYKRLERLVNRHVAGDRDRRRALPPEEALAVVQDGFRLALRYSPYRGTCLSRSILLRALTVAQGLDAALCVGVRKDLNYLQAHAWVCAEGASLGPDSASAIEFNRLPELPATGRVGSR